MASSSGGIGFLVAFGVLASPMPTAAATCRPRRAPMATVAMARSTSARARRGRCRRPGDDGVGHRGSCRRPSTVVGGHGLLDIGLHGCAMGPGQGDDQAGWPCWRRARRAVQTAKPSRSMATGPQTAHGGGGAAPGRGHGGREVRPGHTAGDALARHGVGGAASATCPSGGPRGGVPHLVADGVTPPLGFVTPERELGLSSSPRILTGGQTSTLSEPSATAATRHLGIDVAWRTHKVTYGPA